MGGAIVGLPGSGIGAPQTDNGPTVVNAGLDQVNFIASVWSIFILENRSGFRVYGQAKCTAMSIGIDFPPGPWCVYEGIVDRHTAIIVQSQDFTADGGQRLGVATSCGHIKFAVLATKAILPAPLMLRSRSKISSKFSRALPIPAGPADSQIVSSSALGL